MKKSCVVLLVLCLCSVLAGCTTGTTSKAQTPTPTPIDGYLSTYQDSLSWIKWLEDGNRHITGTWEGTKLDATTHQLTYINMSITGTRSGQQIIMQLQSGILTLAVSGTLVGKHLHLTVMNEGTPEYLDAYGTTQADYQQQLAKLKAKYPASVTPTSTAVDPN
jgi:ABC-type glycerol-3-phosphate transport system substrate-binding protein